MKNSEKIDAINSGVASQVNRGEYKPGVPRFTGLKAAIKGVSGIGPTTQEVDSAESSEITLVGQWIWFDTDRARDRNFYVCVPSMTTGTVKSGEKFDIGDKVFTLDSPLSEIIEAVRNGKALLEKIVKEGMNAKTS